MPLKKKAFKSIQKRCTDIEPLRFVQLFELIGLKFILRGFKVKHIFLLMDTLGCFLSFFLPFQTILFWTFLCTSLSTGAIIYRVFIGYLPRTEMLGQRVYACSTLWNRAKLLSKVIMQFTASMSSEWKLSALSVLTNSWYFWTFWFFLIWWEWNGILYGLNLINVRLIFSYVYWSYIFFSTWIANSWLLSIFDWLLYLFHIYLQ